MQTLEILVFLGKTAVKFNNPLLSKIYVKTPSLLPSVLGPTTASARPMHIYIGVGVLLLYFQKPTTRTNCNTNMQQFFQVIYSNMIYIFLYKNVLKVKKAFIVFV